MSPLINRIRFFHYISAVFGNQQMGPLCRICKAYANTLSALREGVDGLADMFPAEFDALSPEMLRMFEEARSTIAAMPVPENALGQKKAGNCKMPEGVCYIKSSKAIWDRM